VRVEHAGLVFVKDARDQMRLLIKNSAPVEDIAYDLNLLLHE
jgi:hypothetical protein